jgi:hypothetical protein
MISKDNENTNQDFDLAEQIRSTEIELLKAALIKANGDPHIVAQSFGVDVSYIFIKSRQLNLEKYMKVRE